MSLIELLSVPKCAHMESLEVLPFGDSEENRISGKRQPPVGWTFVGDDDGDVLSKDDFLQFSLNDGSTSVDLTMVSDVDDSSFDELLQCGSVLQNGTLAQLLTSASPTAVSGSSGSSPQKMPLSTDSITVEDESLNSGLVVTSSGQMVSEHTLSTAGTLVKILQEGNPVVTNQATSSSNSVMPVCSDVMDTNFSVSDGFLMSSNSADQRNSIDARPDSMAIALAEDNGLFPNFEENTLSLLSGDDSNISVDNGIEAMDMCSLLEQFEAVENFGAFSDDLVLSPQMDSSSVIKLKEDVDDLLENSQLQLFSLSQCPVIQDDSPDTIQGQVQSQKSQGTTQVISSDSEVVKLLKAPHIQIPTKPRHRIREQEFQPKSNSSSAGVRQKLQPCTMEKSSSPSLEEAMQVKCTKPITNNTSTSKASTIRRLLGESGASHSNGSTDPPSTRVTEVKRINLLQYRQRLKQNSNKHCHDSGSSPSAGEHGGKPNPTYFDVIADHDYCQSAAGHTYDKRSSSGRSHSEASSTLKSLLLNKNLSEELKGRAVKDYTVTQSNTSTASRSWPDSDYQMAKGSAFSQNKKVTSVNSLSKQATTSEGVPDNKQGSLERMDTGKLPLDRKNEIKVSPDQKGERSVSPERKDDRKVSSDKKNEAKASSDQKGGRQVELNRKESRKVSPDVKDNGDVSPKGDEDRKMSLYKSDDVDVSQEKNDVSSLSSKKRMNSSMSPDRTLSQKLSPNRKYSRKLSPDAKYNQKMSPDRKYSRKLSPDRKYSRKLSPDRRSLDSPVSPDRTSSQTLSPNRKYSRKLSPDAKYNRKASSDRKYSRKPSPDRKYSRKLSPDRSSQDTPVIDKLPSYCTALAIKPIAGMTVRKSLSASKLLDTGLRCCDRDPSPDRSGPIFNKVPAYFSCFTNSTKYDNLDPLGLNGDDEPYPSDRIQSIDQESCRQSPVFFLGDRRSRSRSRCRRYSTSSSSGHSTSRSRSRSPSVTRTWRYSSDEGSLSSPSRSRSSSGSFSSIYKSHSESGSTSHRRHFKAQSRHHRSRSRTRRRSRSRSYRSHSRSRHRSRHHSRRSHYHSRSRSSYRSRSRSRSSSRDRYWRRYREEMKAKREREKQKRIEERRIVYIGRIPNSMTKPKLRRLFEEFGEIEEVSVHFREHGDNYGFVTYTYTCDAYTAIEKGNQLDGCQNFDLCFGGRREFCKTGYADLDGDKEDEEEMGCFLGRSSADLDFDTLLKQATKKINKF